MTPLEKYTELLRKSENETRVVVPLFKVSFETITNFFRRKKHEKVTTDDSDLPCNHR